MTFVGLFLLGLGVAGVFDWLTAYSMNAYGLQTGEQKRQAALVAFALHGPAGALAAPLFLGGAIDRWLVSFGMKPELAWFASLPVFGVIAAFAIWLISLLPVVRRAKAAIGAPMAAGHADRNRQWARLLGLGAAEGSK